MCARAVRPCQPPRVASSPHSRKNYRKTTVLRSDVMCVDKMYRLIPLLALLAAAAAQGSGGDLESIIAQLQQGQSSTALPAANKNNELDLSPMRPSTLTPGVTGEEDKSCTTENREEGECVPYYLCDSNNTIIDDGSGVIDIRVRDGPCPSYLDTCCVLRDKRKPNNPITPPPPTKEREGCGWNNPDGVGTRITGGVEGEANFAEFPWMVAILRIEPVSEDEPDGQKLNVYVGGGSLIHPSVVLTAAHYVAAAGALRVRAGEWDTQTKNELYPYQDRDVKQVVVHKDFNKGNLFYDIAVLFLSAPVDPAPNVGVACLPPVGARAADGTRCFASGWGKDVFGKEGRYQVILKRVQLPVVERSRCEQLLQKTRLGVHFRLHSSFMCAGGERGADTCKGDGGSPLVCPAEYDKDRYVQYGIVAWGIGCGENTPGVYVDVGKLRAWIDDKVQGQGLDPNVYTLL